MVGPVVIVLQLVATQEFADVALCGVHEATGVGPVATLVGQDVVVQLLPVPAASGTQDAAPVGPVVTDGQVVDVQLLPPPAGTGVQLPLGMELVTGVQLVTVHELADVAGEAEQVCTGVFVVVTVLQLTVR